jgi:tetratricopeptide (TPR) repeat protein
MIARLRTARIILMSAMTNKATSALGQGVMLLSNGAYDLAIEKCSEAIGFDRAHAAAFYMRALARRAKGEHAHAGADFEQVSKLAPPGSIAGFKETIRWALGDATAFYNRGSAYHNERDYDRAINNYSEAIRLNPSYVAALLNRAVALLERDRNNPRSSKYDERFGGVPDCDRAMADYRRVLALDADDTARQIAKSRLDELMAQERVPIGPSRTAL